MFSLTCSPNSLLTFWRENHSHSKVSCSLIGQGKGRFSVAIDSVNEMLRYASMSSVAGLLGNLRSNDQVSSIFWLLTVDLHEARITAVFEYMSSMTASFEPLSRSANGRTCDLENLSLLQRYFGEGKFHVRFKRTNGRVRVMCEEFHVDQSGINFSPVSSEDGITTQALLPKVQFSLLLSEKERIDKERAVLPFEDQDLSQKAKMRQHLFQLENCKPMRNLSRARLYICVILMTSCQIPMRTQMMIWIYDSVCVYSRSIVAECAQVDIVPL